MMYNLNKISRQQLIGAACLIGVFIICAMLGRYQVQGELSHQLEAGQNKAQQTDPHFVLPANPPGSPVEVQKRGAGEATTVKSQQDAANDELDMVEARVWEIAAKQPLPPRKEPLTPARWRIVGVTAVGDEKSVLVFFENQPMPEIRKVGEKLPGGAKIIEIAQDHLKILLNGQIMNLSLRKQ